VIAASTVSESRRQGVETATAGTAGSSHSAKAQRQSNKEKDLAASSRRSTARRPSHDLAKESVALAGELSLLLVSRVTTCLENLENLEMSGNLEHVREMSVMLFTVREMSGKKFCHGKVSQNGSLLDEY